jgi:hypothetical protein
MRLACLRHAFIRIAIDWTVENGIHTLVAATLIGRRAVLIYWRSYDESSFKGHRSRIERAAVSRLFKLILRDVPRYKLIVTADRGTAFVLLFDLLDDLKIAFVMRITENVKVFFQGTWRKLGRLKMTRNTRRRSLGRLRYCHRSPRRFYITYAPRAGEAAAMGNLASGFKPQLQRARNQAGIRAALGLRMRLAAMPGICSN